MAITPLVEWLRRRAEDIVVTLLLPCAPFVPYVLLPSMWWAVGTLASVAVPVVCLLVERGAARESRVVDGADPAAGPVAEVTSPVVRS